MFTSIKISILDAKSLRIDKALKAAYVSRELRARLVKQETAS